MDTTPTQHDLPDALLVTMINAEAGAPAGDVITYAETITLDTRGGWDCQTVPLLVDNSGARVEASLLREAIGCDGYDAREVTLASDDGVWVRVWIARDGRALVLALTEDGREGAQVPHSVIGGLRMMQRIGVRPAGLPV